MIVQDVFIQKNWFKPKNQEKGYPFQRTDAVTLELDNAKYLPRTFASWGKVKENHPR